MNKLWTGLVIPMNQITKNVYLHVTQEMKKEASHKFGQLMRSFR
ncbi:hypothetical protein ACFWNP_25615 [Peribacillus butanolivorans]